MVTARWEQGPDGHSAAVDYAAVIAGAGTGAAAGAPANLAGQALGALRPLARDGDWRDSVRVAGTGRPTCSWCGPRVSPPRARGSRRPRPRSR